MPQGAGAQEHEHGHEHAGLHFSHPLVTESVSPDTKLRLDLAAAAPAGARELQLGGEYAFSRGASIEGGVSWNAADHTAGEAELTLKFARYRWEARGLLVGGGVGVGVPLHGDEEETEAEPFLNAGLRLGELELVAATQLAVPLSDSAAGASLGWNGSALYHLSDRLQALLEYRGTRGISGESRAPARHAIAPGLKVQPLHEHALAVGASVLVPLTGEREFDTRTLVSAFYHF